MTPDFYSVEVETTRDKKKNRDVCAGTVTSIGTGCTVILKRFPRAELRQQVENAIAKLTHEPR